MDWNQLRLKLWIDIQNSNVPWQIRKIRKKDKKVYVCSGLQESLGQWVDWNIIYPQGTYSECEFELTLRQCKLLANSLSNNHGPFYPLHENYSNERTYCHVGLFLQIHTYLLPVLIGLILEYLDAEVRVGETFLFCGELVHVTKIYPGTGYSVVDVRKRFQDTSLKSCSVYNLSLTTDSRHRIYHFRR